MLVVGPNAQRGPSTTRLQLLREQNHGCGARTTLCLLLPPLPDRALAIASLSHLHPKGGGTPSHPSSYQQLQIRLAEPIKSTPIDYDWPRVLTFLTSQLRRVHRLAQNFHS